MSVKDSSVYKSASKEGKRRLEVVSVLSPLKRYLYWIKERESIRLKKEKGEPKPWTVDPILRDYRFCNVRRMDDKVSKWLYNNWYVPYYGHKNMILAVVMARHFNQPEALDYIGFPKKWDPGRVYARILEMKRRYPERRVFNGAYMIRSSSNSSPRFYPDKSEMVVRETVQQFVDDPLDLNTDSMEKAVEQFLEYRNFGTFMAGQVVADLRWAVPGHWSDKYDWASIGPGSRRGMNRLKKRDLKFPLKQGQFLTELTDVMVQARKSLPVDTVDRLEAIDFQNCFCEFDKFERTLWGESKPKQKYPGKEG